MACEHITVCDFYDNLDNEYKVFSNYSSYPVNIDDEEWPTSEHYYHSKFSSEDTNDDDTSWYKNIIKNCSTANKSKQLGNQKSGRYGETTIINTKNDIIDESKSRCIIFKNRIMYRVIKEKINQHPKIKDILLNTENSVIREASPYDFYWGMGKNNTGKNMLGNIFMKIRDELRGINYREMEYYEEMTDKSRYIKLSTKNNDEQAYDLLFDSEDKSDDEKLIIKEKAMYMLQKENLENYNILKLRYLIKIYSTGTRGSKEKYIFTAKRKIQLVNDLEEMIKNE